MVQKRASALALFRFERASPKSQQCVSGTKAEESGHERHNTDVTPPANFAESGKRDQRDSRDNPEEAINGADVWIHGVSSPVLKVLGLVVPPHAVRASGYKNLDCADEPPCILECRYLARHERAETSKLPGA
jgi:hypothetical protein